MKEFFPGYVNILKTIIGSGILYIPMLFKTFGAIPTAILMMISCVLSVTGQLIYVHCNFTVNDRSGNITTLAQKSIPRTTFLVDFFVFFKCFGVSTSYLIIIRELLPNLLKHSFGEGILTQPKISLLIFLCCISPITFFRQLDNLKYTSSIGLMSISLILIFSVINFSSDPSTIKNVNFFEILDIEALKALGTFVFAFTCHQNLVSVQNEMIDNSPKRLQKLIFSTAISSFIIYMIFGFFNYALFARNMHDNILKSYPNNQITIFLHFMYIMVMGFSYPLQINPARVYFLNLLKIKRRRKKNNFIHALITTILLISTYALTITGLNLGEIYAFIGSTASTMICLVFPPLIYHYMDMQKKKILIFMGLICLLIGAGVFSLSFCKFLFHTHISS